MGIFDSLARGLGSLRPLSDAELEDEREEIEEELGRLAGARYKGSREWTRRIGRSR